MATVSPYLESQIYASSPARLQLLLLEGALRYTQHARQGIADQDFNAAQVGFDRAFAILDELLQGLRPNRDADLCDKMAGLYAFCQRKILEGSTRRQPELLDDAIKILENLRDTWRLLLEQIAVETTPSYSTSTAGIHSSTSLL